MFNRTCFILMPFTKANDLGTQDLDFIYENIIRKAVSNFQYNGEIHFQNVSRFENNVGSIIEGIVNKLNDSELVIADLTGLNHNVMYELGVRHSLRNGTVVITQNINELPSDLRDYLAIEYKYCKHDAIAQANYYQEFETKVHAAIIEVIAQTKNDSPILNYLNQRQRFRNENELERVKDSFVILHSIRTIVHEIDDMISYINPNGYGYNEDLLLFELLNTKVSSLQKTIELLNLSYSTKSLFIKIINSKVLLDNVRSILNININLLTHIAINKQSSVRPMINKVINISIVDNFSIDLGKLEYVQLGKVFNKDGIIEKHLIYYLISHLEQKFEQIGIQELEVLQLLK